MTALHPTQPDKIVGPIGVPIGTLLPFAGTRELLEDLLGKNQEDREWMLCDGSEIRDVDSPFYGSRVPDLREDRFLMGVSGDDEVLETGGRNDIPEDGDHAHHVGGGAHAHTGLIPAGGQGGILGGTGAHEHDVSVTGDHRHGAENRPRFLAVYFIMRIK